MSELNAANPQITPIAVIRFFSNNPQKGLLGLMNQKIEQYNALLQNPKKGKADAAFLLLQEIEYYADFLTNHSDPDLSSPGRSWVLSSGITLQPGRFEPLTAVQIDHGALDFAALFAKAEVAGVNKTVIEGLKAKLNSAPYQNSATSIRNHAILQQLRKAILYAAMTTDHKKPGPLQAILSEVDSNLHAVIQAEPALQQDYVLQQEYSRYFDVFYQPAKKEDALSFMRALTLVETHLLNASDETIIEFYKNNPRYGTIPQKSGDAAEEASKDASVKNRKVSIDDLKAEWKEKGALTIAQLSALAPTLFQENDLQFLAAGNNITWRLKNKDSGDYLILRASKQKLTNLDHIDTLKDTLAGEYFSAEYATLIGAINENDRVEDYTLSLIEYCAKGNLQHVRKNIPAEDSALIQKEASRLLSPFMDFCAKLVDENAYLTDIKLSNFLVDEISDLKSVRVCAAGTDLHHLSRADVTGDITPLYAPPEWEGDYTVIECSALPARNAHKLGEIYYDATTHHYSVLGYNREFYQGQEADLGDKKKQNNAIRKIEKEIRFDMDKFMAYQMGLALYDFLTGLTIILEGDSSAERNEARAEALERLKAFKESGTFDYSAAVFNGVEGQVLKELCIALLKTNPKERMSVKEAATKLTALQMQGSKAKLLQEYIKIYKKHNEQFHSDPEFMQKYEAMKAFLFEIREAKTIVQDNGFLQHALEAEAIRLEAWLQHAIAQPHKVEHFYPHYTRSLLNEGFTAQVHHCHHIAHQLSTIEGTQDSAAERKALLGEIAAMQTELEAKMAVFLNVHHNNVAVTPVAEFAKLFEAASALKSYMENLKTNFPAMSKEELQKASAGLAALTEAATTEEWTQNLKREALSLRYSIAYREKDEAQGVAAPVIALRQSLIHHFLATHPNLSDTVTKELDVYLASFFSEEAKKGLIERTQRYEEKFTAKEYAKAYGEASETNKQIVAVYTKLLGEDDEDPIVVQMTQLRAETNDALKSGVLSHQGAAETMHKVNVELMNSISYLAGPRLTPFKPVHREEDWKELREESVNIKSTKKKWAHRVLMGVAVPLAAVLMIGSGGLLAVPSIAVEIGSRVSPNVANSAANLVSLSSIWARAKTVFSGDKGSKDADRLFGTAEGLASATQAKVGTLSSSKSMLPTTLSPSHSGLFHHGAESRGAQKQNKDDSEGSKDSGTHIDPTRK